MPRNQNFTEVLRERPFKSKLDSEEWAQARARINAWVKYRQAGKPVVTQQVLVKQLEADGFEITVPTLRKWLRHHHGDQWRQTPSGMGSTKSDG